MLKLLSIIAFFTAGTAALAADVVQAPFAEKSLESHGTAEQKAMCASGQKPISGGYDITADRMLLSPSASHPFSDGSNFGWRVAIVNQSDVKASLNVTAYAICQ